MAIKQDTPVIGARRGDVSVNDHVEVERGWDEPPAEGQVVAETDDGKVSVALLQTGETVEVDRSDVWQKGVSVEEL